MSKFDASLWKSIHPPSTEGSGIVAAIKDWQAHCPEKYDQPNADPKKLIGIVTPAAKKFLAAITDAENKLARDKSADAETKGKIVKTKALLAKWKTEIVNYQNGLTKWWQDSIKEESQDQKNLLHAQLAFTTALVDELQAALNKLPALEKAFDAALKAEKLDEAARALRAHRDLLSPANFNLRPVSVAKFRQEAANKFKVDAPLLKVPPKFNELAKKLGEMNTKDDDMQDRLERALDGEADDEADADGTSGPEYRKDVRTLADLCRSNAAKTKAKLAVITQLAGSFRQIQAIPAAGPAYQKGVAGIHALNQKMLTVSKELHALRGESYRKGGKLELDATGMGMKETDVKKFLVPHASLALADAKRFVLACEDLSTLMEEWLAAAAEAHPAAGDARGELANVKARKYTVQVL